VTTNITDTHRDAFDALTSGRFDNFALFSCFANGEPAVAIVAVNHEGESSRSRRSSCRSRQEWRSPITTISRRPERSPALPAAAFHW